MFSQSMNVVLAGAAADAQTVGPPYPGFLYQAFGCWRCGHSVHAASNGWWISWPVADAVGCKARKRVLSHLLALGAWVSIPIAARFFLDAHEMLHLPASHPVHHSNRSHRCRRFCTFAMTLLSPS